MPIYIMGIAVNKRSQFAPRVQEVLTKHGENIMARFGIHDDSDDGLITLNVKCDEKYIEKFSDELSNIPSVKVNHMIVN